MVEINEVEIVGWLNFQPLVFRSSKGDIFLKYMKIIWALLFLTAISAPCDILPEPPTPDYFNQINEEKPPFALPKGVEISMKSAHVKILFNRLKTTDTIRAKVWCVFDMMCTLAPEGGTSFQMGFPVYEMKIPAVIQSFDVDINGKNIEPPKEKSWKSFGTKNESSNHDGARETDIDDETNQNYRGFFWPVTFEQGETKRIKVTYTLELPTKNSCTDFTYAVSSGALWSGCIGKEVVRATAENGLILNNDPSKKILEWSFVRMNPDRDISIHICIPSRNNHSPEK